MNSSVIFRFLNELSQNNNREWFNNHRSEYENASAEFESLLTVLISQIANFDTSIKGINPKDCTYRIYRDTRFSSDKTPYKIHLGGYINAKGKKSYHAGYYIHIEPGNCMVGGGSICLPPKLLKGIRQSIYDNIDEYRSIIEEPSFKKYFPIVGDDCLKTAPKGFSKDFKYIDLIKPKEYICIHHVSDDFFSKTNFIDELVPIFKEFKKFADFINYTIDDYEQ